jgi:hypothetical protein
MSSIFTLLKSQVQRALSHGNIDRSSELGGSLLRFAVTVLYPTYIDQITSLCAGRLPSEHNCTLETSWQAWGKAVLTWFSILVTKLLKYIHIH